MRIYSAADAISPAFSRTKLVLFTPFRWGRSWKLAATGYLSFAGTIFFPFMLVYLAATPLLARGGGSIAVAVAVTGILTVAAIYCVFFVLCSRLQFAFFDIVLNRGEFVAPAWRKYGAVSWRWTAIKVMVGVGVIVIGGLLAFPVMRVFFLQMANMPNTLQGAQPNALPPAAMLNFMAAFYAAYFGFMFFIGLYYLAMSTAGAFMVPSMALEGLSPGAAFQRMVAFIRQQTGAFFGFVGLRLLLGIAGYMGVALAYEIVFFVLGVIFALVCWAAYLVLHALHVPLPVLIGLGVLAALLFVVCAGGYLGFLVVGTFFTFFEAHTLYFLGGRYPLMGDLLERSTPPPPPMPPSAYAWPAQYPPPPYPPPPYPPPPYPPPQG